MSNSSTIVVRAVVNVEPLAQLVITIHGFAQSIQWPRAFELKTPATTNVQAPLDLFCILIVESSFKISGLTIISAICVATCAAADLAQ